jgi:hypothetical protein
MSFKKLCQVQNLAASCESTDLALSALAVLLIILWMWSRGLIQIRRSWRRICLHDTLGSNGAVNGVQSVAYQVPAGLGREVKSDSRGALGASLKLCSPSPLLKQLCAKLPLTFRQAVTPSLCWNTFQG